ncbi:uncharacterized protein TRIADDRAFT_28550 [Trichoplax adhaerens]|uniref:Choline/carnitine acyltransferase domain-containing protein n=1 Tax=Trichoplax adhaerens TaxID=10228 RepID=B3S3X0_TRIAD|nr:hypothetical protein TRIADDRAFT_28550 [Trichoplax adhaerens]EDV22543.1 hypothetical protein TRIADDRAFT_28550 [Trichoplax adhaerens]|eukprot:XP_002115087.1 hypothetical protein TRIADDRAFT_28550 [Trichoplax adhaerens]
MPSEATFCYDDKLPKQPVPDLQGSLKKYLASALPMVSDEQYAKTEALVKEFGKPGGIGEQLHQVVVEKAKTTKNWLADWWTDAYLKSRQPVVLTSSVGAISGYEPVQTEDEYINLSARAAVSLATYYQQIYQQTLPVYKAGETIFCMHQAKHYFASGRIPRQDRDDFEYQKLDDDLSTHMIVSHNNQFFVVEAIKDNKVVSYAEMKMQIQRIMQMSTEIAEPVGILTTADRETWANALRLLNQDPDNYRNWRTIHRAIIVLSLETKKVEPSVQPDHPDYMDELYSIFTANGLHGYGTQFNSGNRWNDKVLNFSVNGYGCFGLAAEHSNIDGVPIFQLVYLIEHYMYVYTSQSVSQEVLNQVEQPKRIEWKLNDELHQIIRQTAEKFDKAVEDVNQRGMIFDDYGKEFIKSIKMSPDSFIQMALQLTYYILENKLPNHYESCSMARYTYGRTETIRSTTSKSKILCEVWVDPKSTINDKKVAFIEAVKAHSQLAKETAMGKAWDRIMFAMATVASEKGLPQPEIFSDPAFQLMSQFQLSTSQGTYGPFSNSIFAAVCNEGYGVSYNIQPDRLTFTCSNFNSCERTSSKKFLNSLRQFLRDFKQLVTSSK